MCGRMSSKEPAVEVVRLDSNGLPGIQVGEYTLFKTDGDEFIGIVRKDGEGGLFQAKEFEAYIAAFFGLNF